jgi:hypothetical protein
LLVVVGLDVKQEVVLVDIEHLLGHQVAAQLLKVLLH